MRTARPPGHAEETALLERGEELAALDAALAACRLGTGELVVIEGPAGIGKSSVVAEGRSRAGDAGMTVLQARGSELEGAFSYGVVRQLFEPALARADAGERGRLLGGVAVHAARLFDPAAVVGGEPASEDAAFALHHGLYWLVVNLAESRPLVLAIDDLQWADAASVRWVSYLGRRLEGLRVCVLAAVRPLEDEGPVLAELLADPGTTVVRPTALSAAAVAELVRAGLSPEAEDEFCLACHRATGGNPLFVRELVRTLGVEEVAPTAASAEAVERLAPDAVSRSVRVRLSRLPAEAASVARAVAVLGDGAEGSHVARLAEIDPRALAAAAATLARAHLLHADPPFRFVHPVVRNAVYESIPADERAQDHARAATMLASAGAAREAVAAQLLLAPPETADGAVATLRAAARRAVADGALESATRYLRRALQEPVEPEERGGLLLELAGSELWLGTTTVVETLRDAVTLVREPRTRREAYLELGRALAWSLREEDAVQALEQALAEDPDADDELSRRIEADLIASAIRVPSLHADARNRLDSLDFTVVEGVGAHMLLGLHAFHETTQGRGRERAVAHAEQALSAIPPEEQGFSVWAPLGVLVFADRLDEGLRYVEASLANARLRGGAYSFAGGLVSRAMLRFAAGALEEAEADLRIAFDQFAQRQVRFVPHTYGYLAQVLVERGAPAEAAEVLGAAAAELGEIPEQFWYLPLIRARGMVASARGDHQAALADALTTGRILAAVGAVNPAVSSPGWRSQAALVHHALGAEAEALGLAREEVELAREWGAPRALGRALRVLGSLEGGGEGSDHLREAVDVLEASPARLEYANALTDLGAALRRGNRRAEAREPLRQALELAQRIGAVVAAERAHDELIASGARPRRLVTTGVDALTPSERRVAALAAEGLSNREIAQSLFVALRTVEMHLSNAFRKLGVSARTQLPAALAAGRT